MILQITSLILGANRRYLNVDLQHLGQFGGQGEVKLTEDDPLILDLINHLQIEELLNLATEVVVKG